jgi:putative acetyltransferase
MKIRLAKDGDYSGIARLHRETIRHVNSKDYPGDVIRVWSARAKAERYRKSADELKRWVAIENSKIVGFCDHGSTCEIRGLYVHKDYLGRGIGSYLLKVAEDSLRKQGCKRIVIKSTITAQNFYENHGYKTGEGGFHDMEGKKIKFLNMRKILG